MLRLAIRAQLYAILDIADGHSQPGVTDPAVANDHLRHPAGLANGDGKAIGATWSHVDEGIDADHLALQIHQGPARVAWVDLGVSLNVLAHTLA